MEEAYLSILKEIGEDPERDGLKDTPTRAANAMRFLTQGYTTDIDKVINGALFSSESDEMVMPVWLTYLLNDCKSKKTSQSKSRTASYRKQGRLVQQSLLRQSICV